MSLHSSQQEMKDNGLDINHKSLHHTTKTASPEFKDKLSKQVDQWIANDQKRKTFGLSGFIRRFQSVGAIAAIALLGVFAWSNIPTLSSPQTPQQVVTTQTSQQTSSSTRKQFDSSIARQAKQAKVATHQQPMLLTQVHNIKHTRRAAPKKRFKRTVGKKFIQ